LKAGEEGISLNKYISSTGFCSRREADALIAAARVTVNDELVIGPARVGPKDVVAVDGEKLKAPKPADYFIIAYNKPRGVTSTTDPKDRTNIIYAIGHPKRIFPIGRLDKDSEGLIFLTNDGDVVNHILRAENGHEKEYHVTVDKKLEPHVLQKMAAGVRILNDVTGQTVTTLPCKVVPAGSRAFRIVLRQGLNRQIRRMCEALGYKAMSLRRVRIMGIGIGNLQPGKWRYLSAPELEALKGALQSD
jgi:23S rRNA pseudouridine2604 synthase